MSDKKLCRCVLLVALLLVAGCLGGARERQVAALGMPGATGIAGMVLDQHGTPAVGSHVYAYRSAKGGLRGPADFAAIVGQDGSYFLDLVEGEYHLIARQRSSGSDSGPPRAGDAWSLFTGNPLRVVANRTSRADFRLQGVTQPRLFKQGSLTSGDTGMRGTIIDAEGKAVAGAFVLAYSDGNFRHMPDFTSPVVGSDGRFTLYLPGPGRYCLAVRTKTRGQPQAGELYGVLGEGEGACRTLQGGEMLDVGTITVKPYQR
jgi:hypothetical protein